jgi:hypothetical protein
MAGLAQLVEQRFCKPKVGGSIPSAGTTGHMVKLLLALCALLAGCSVGLTVTNSPDTLPCAPASACRDK